MRENRSMGKNRDVMKLIRVVVILAGLLFLNGVLAAGTSSATMSPVECQVSFLDLQHDTYASRSSFTNQTDFTASYGKLIAVWPRLTGGIAPPDTLQILTDYQAALNALAAASPPKIDPAVAQRLVTGAQYVIDCVNVNNP
jgi:hypothetical protein